MANSPSPGSPPPDEVLARGQFGPFRATWILGGIGFFCLVASIKFIIVDRAPEVAPYPALGALPFGLVAAICWIRSGRFWITKKTVHWQARRGPPFEVAVADIVSVETGTNKLPRLDITHTGGMVHLPSISARGKAAAALRSLGKRVT